jgi:hypothetical protein
MRSARRDRYDASHGAGEGPNELLEKGDGERVDFGKASATIVCDPSRATMAAVDRAANG